MDFSKSSQQFRDYSFCYSSQLELPFSLKILSLEGHRTPDSYSQLIQDPKLSFSGLNLPYHKSDFYIVCQVWSRGRPFTTKVRTKYKNFSTSWSWHEWLDLPIKYSNLPLDSKLVLDVYDIKFPTAEPILVGGTCLELFTNNHKLRQGRQKLYLWSNCEGDGINPKSKTPAKPIEKFDELDRLEKLLKKQKNGDIASLDWLDRLAYQQIDRLRQEAQLRTDKLCLYIDLPKFDFPLVFQEEVGHRSCILKGGQNLVVIVDRDIGRENVCESKHRRLIRSHRSNPLDKELKPNPQLRDKINTIINYPPTKELTGEEKDLLWKFRYYLTKDKKALTKFLKSVVWEDSVEVAQAIELLQTWQSCNIADALELLGPHFLDPTVRSYAVAQLREATDEVLVLYLLQLVQALKFEAQSSSLIDFLLERAVQNPNLAVTLYWYLKVESEDLMFGLMYQRIMTTFLSMVPDPTLFKKQTDLVNYLFQLSKDVRNSKDTLARKKDKFKAMLSDPKCPLRSFDPLPLPLDPTVSVVGVIPEKCSIFKSSLQPLKLTFKTEDNSEYIVIFKNGDDLRQDQLVVQIITLIDNLLRQENLDLKLTPYRVLATGSDQGMVQFVPSLPLATILAEHDNSLLRYLQLYHPSPNAPLNLEPSVLDCYLRSNAGYCVITYLLGVGDRHLDNLLLTTQGNLFHVDFGYLLGRDPKPFPPPMKLCLEMIEAMGGNQGEPYHQFHRYCYEAYNLLRQSAPLLLNLLAMMTSANVPDLAVEPDKAVMKVQDKFNLELDDANAIIYFEHLINNSVNALLPQVMETIHKWAQYWRQ